MTGCWKHVAITAFSFRSFNPCKFNRVMLKEQEGWEEKKMSFSVVFSVKINNYKPVLHCCQVLIFFQVWLHSGYHSGALSNHSTSLLSHEPLMSLGKRNHAQQKPTPKQSQAHTGQVYSGEQSPQISMTPLYLSLKIKWSKNCVAMPSRPTAFTADHQMTTGVCGSCSFVHWEVLKECISDPYLLPPPAGWQDSNKVRKEGKTQRAPKHKAGTQYPVHPHDSFC